MQEAIQEEESDDFANIPDSIVVDADVVQRAFSESNEITSADNTGEFDKVLQSQNVSFLSIFM